jgi:hypothetical protein
MRGPSPEDSEGRPPMFFLIGGCRPQMWPTAAKTENCEGGYSSLALPPRTTCNLYAPPRSKRASSSATTESSSFLNSGAGWLSFWPAGSALGAQRPTHVL